VVALVALAAVACVPTQPPPPPPQFTTLDCSAPAADQVITVNTRLEAGCTYTGRFTVRQSNVILDCNGAVVDGTGKSGAGIAVATPADVDMGHVTVRNCNTVGWVNGMKVTRDGFRQLPAGHEYDHTLTDVTIQNSTVTNSRGVGIFVDGYTQRTTIVQSKITGAGSSGIYLEAGSRNNVVVLNELHDNGFIENGPGGQLFEVGGHTWRFWGTGREGLSIDGSYDNLVWGNHFAGNSAGGIFLYTNCSEFVNQKPERFFQRRTKAERNLIENNTFEGGLNGIWVGSRMSENTYPMDCANPAYIESGITRITLDYANDNTILRNTFHNVTYGVRVEDDGTRVEGNQFSGDDATYHAVIVGTKWRTSNLDRPVTGTVVTGNSSSIAGNPSPYRWQYGLGTLAFDGTNTALGAPATICQTPKTIPINALIFVLALALEDPPAPVTPTPDLTIATIGALPPCPV
jgi:parallel beta-helix repeat protein